MNVVYNHCYIIVNLNFIHPCNGFACNIESVLYVVRCLLPPAAHRAPVLARECRGSGARQQLRGTVCRGGAAGSLHCQHRGGGRVFD